MALNRPLPSITHGSTRLAVLMLFVWVALVGSPAHATSYVLMSDAALVDQAPTVVVGRVLSKDNSPAQGTPSTDYLVEIERVLKGGIPGTTVVVRVPGGIGPDGKALILYGAPRLAEDSTVILFLKPGADGAFRIVHLMMGAFHGLDHNGETVLLRDFGEAVEVDRAALGIGDPKGQAPSRAPRDLERFAGWIADRAQGVERPADYYVTMAASEIDRLRDYFTLITDDNGVPVRWFSFQDGLSERFRRTPGGQPGLTAQQLDAALRAGINAWNSVGNTKIVYVLSPPVAHNGGLTNPDGVNGFLFDDPNNNDTMGGVFACGEGGVLAVGGPWIADPRSVPFRQFEGRPHYEILEADIVTNKGISCIFNRGNAQAIAAELFGHELGHTLGIDHSSERENEPDPVLRNALMYFRLSANGKGAQLNSDDIAAARRLYRDGTAPPPPPPPTAPAAPTNLAAEVLSPTAVRLTWADNADNETRYVVQARPAGGSFAVVRGGLSANTTGVDVVDLDPGTRYTFRVQAFNQNIASGFSNAVDATTPPEAPTGPDGLTARPVSLTQIELVWNDRSDAEEQFVIQVRSPEMDWQQAGVTGSDISTFIASGLSRETPYTFRVQAVNGSGASPFSNEASATTLGAEGPCRQDDRSLCLLGDRFEVRVEYKDQFNGGNGPATAVPVPGSDISGLFYFFNEANIELIVKMLDGRSLNGFFWNFYGALSTVEYWISVRDVETSEQVTYHNPPDELCGLADVTAFPRQEALPQPAETGPRLVNPRSATEADAVALRLPLGADAGVTGTCVPGANVLCLLDNRFRVEVAWDNPRPPFNSGVGTVAPVATVNSDQTGFFWFFQEDNIELVIKILDARPINDKFWVFYGALSDVGYELRVTDTVTGASKVYTNEAFNLCGLADINAF